MPGSASLPASLAACCSPASLPTCLPTSVQVILRQPVIDPDGDVSLYFIVFGGSFQAAYFKPCSDFSLRIRLDIKCSTKPCTHSFGGWEVETMPGSRCMADALVLPNGKVIIIGGGEEGLSNLEYR